MHGTNFTLSYHPCTSNPLAQDARERRCPGATTTSSSGLKNRTLTGRSGLLETTPGRAPTQVGSTPDGRAQCRSKARRAGPEGRQGGFRPAGAQVPAQDRQTCLALCARPQRGGGCHPGGLYQGLSRARRLPRRERVLYLAVPDRSEYGKKLPRIPGPARTRFERGARRRGTKRGRRGSARAGHAGALPSDRGDRRHGAPGARKSARGPAHRHHAARNRGSKLRGDRRGHGLSDRHGALAYLPRARGHRQGVEAAVAGLTSHFGVTMKEHLSALMDNELDELSERRLHTQLASDADLRQSWERYHLARAALRGELEEGAGPRLAERLHAAVEAEKSGRGTRRLAPALKLAGGAGGRPPP